MTRLRQIMLDEPERRNFAPSTIRAYLRTVEHFAHYFRCPPDRLGTEHIRQVSGSDVSDMEAVAEHRAAEAGGAALSLHPGTERGRSVAETP